MGARIRQWHRWTSMIFILVVIGIFAVQAFTMPPQWVYFLSLPFLFFLMLTGIYMFVSHYRQTARS